MSFSLNLSPRFSPCPVPVLVLKTVDAASILVCLALTPELSCFRRNSQSFMGLTHSSPLILPRDRPPGLQSPDHRSDPTNARGPGGIASCFVPSSPPHNLALLPRTEDRLDGQSGSALYLRMRSPFLGACCSHALPQVRGDVLCTSQS